MLYIHLLALLVFQPSAADFSLPGSTTASQEGDDAVFADPASGTAPLGKHVFHLHALCAWILICRCSIGASYMLIVLLCLACLVIVNDVQTFMALSCTKWLLFSYLECQFCPFCENYHLHYFISACMSITVLSLAIKLSWFVDLL